MSGLLGGCAFTGEALLGKLLLWRIVWLIRINW